MFFLPLLVKVLKGPRRIFIILQQLSILCFLAFSLISNWSNSDVSDMQKAMEQVSEFRNKSTTTAVIKSVVFGKTVEFFQDFCYYEFYFLAWMHSWDMYEMICNPLKYADFCKKLHLIKVILSGTGVCALLACTNIVNMTIAIILLTFNDGLDQSVLKYNNITDGINIFDIIKTVILKVVYSVVITRLSLSSKSGLDQSSKMASNQNDQKSIFKKFFYFSLMPIFINILFLIHEIPDATFSVFNESTCGSHLVRVDIRFCLTTSAVTIGLLSYLFSFLILFPKIRKTIIHCGTDNN